MIRSFFLALGIYGCFLGIECLFVDTAVLRAKERQTAASILPFGKRETEVNKKISPPDWAPWSLVSAGVVTVLYSFTLPSRFRGG